MPLETWQLVNFALAVALGLLIGTEREVSKRLRHTAIGGIRTFPLSSIVGYVVGILSRDDGGIIAAAGIVGIAGIAIAAGIRGQARGITTELALLLTCVVGVALGSGHTIPALLAAVVGTVLLSRKTQLHQWVGTLTPDDIRAIVTFAIVAAVVLPLLPDVPLGPEGVLNPRRVWMVVVLVTGINVAGYVASKYLHARHSIVLSAVVGSLVSSTAVTWAFASQSREQQQYAALYGVGIALGSGVMLARVGFYAGVVSRPLLVALLPLLIACAVVGLGVLWLCVRRIPPQVPEQELHTPFPPANPARLQSALLFGVLYASIATAAVLLQRAIGQSALIALGAASGIADVDAITLAMAHRTTNESISTDLAVGVVAAAMLVNTLVKMGISLLRAERQTRRIVAFSLGATAVVLALVVLRSFVAM
ncbi:MAG: hypothetical protein KatS3mg039_1637 [Candidatus Kapaibacterium sp.]|nr:MAG: hypothetical protein KatS3mg039_1637 [Candidatus Kapabacteria bacterium]